MAKQRTETSEGMVSEVTKFGTVFVKTDHGRDIFVPKPVMQRCLAAQQVPFEAGDAVTVTYLTDDPVPQDKFPQATRIDYVVQMEPRLRRRDRE